MVSKILADDEFKLVQDFKTAYDSNTPFPAVALDGILNDEFLKCVRRECLELLDATGKSSDLYEKFQSLDFANLAVVNNPENLTKLYDFLKGPDFRQYISKVTGVSEELLTGSVDGHVHIFKEGHYLLPHDDNVGNRKIAFIIYLVDTWEESMGGRLELYDTTIIDEARTRQPKPDPHTYITPQWNRIGIFEVKPNISWHAVEEIRSGSRLSIQGWIHSSVSEPDDTMTKDEIHDMIDKLGMKESVSLPVLGEDTSTGIRANSCLTTEDMKLLQVYMNPLYLKEEVINQLREGFLNSSLLVLANYLKKDMYKPVQKQCLRIDENETDVSTSVVVEGPASVRRYQRFTDESPVGKLSNFKRDFMETVAFRRYITEITGLSPANKYTSSIRRFRRGKDYTLAIAPSDEDRVDISYVVIKEADWDEMGGQEILVPAFEEETDEGQTADISGLSAVPLELQGNSLSLVLRPIETPCCRYVKFVKSGAPSSRWEVYQEYSILDEEIDGDLVTEEGDVVESAEV